jgi:hypothetical protein
MKFVGMILFALTLSAQGPATPSNALSVHWMVREDLFAGMLEDDHERLKKGLATLDAVGKYYDEAPVLSWRYMAEVTQAVWAYEAKDNTGFNRHYGLALTYLNRLRKVASGNDLALPEIFEGGALAVLAERFPESMRKGVWERAYAAYANLDKLQGESVNQMPMHIKGESLAGLAATAYRTGREAEMTKTLERMQVVLAKTPYAAVARKWAEDPAARSKVKMVCISCHEPNRLGSRIERSHFVK